MGERRGISLLGLLEEAGMALDTTVRGISNTVTMGNADRFAAAMDSIPALWGPETYAAALQRNLQKQAARNAQDERYRPISKRGGEFGGVALGLMRGQVPRMPAPMLSNAKVLTQGPQARLPAAMAAGAAVSAGTQSAADLASGRPVTPSRVAANAIPGALGPVGAKMGGPQFGGLVDGMTGSVIGNVLDGEPISIEQAMQGGLAGSKGASVGETMAASRLARLNIEQKGKLGDLLSVMQSPFRGDIPFARQRAFPVPGGRTVADWAVFRPWNVVIGRNPIVPVEAKYGHAVRLSPRQRQAADEYADYTVDHFQQDEVADLVGLLMGSATARAPSADSSQAADHEWEELKQRLNAPLNY